MRRIGSSVLAVALLGGASSLVLAQDGERDGFRTQETTGWTLAEPADDAGEDERISDPLRDAPLVVGDQQFGWQVAPVAPDESVEELSELERLSISPSGVRFGGQLYDSKSDNPLEPVSVTLRALDKITAQYTDLEIEMDGTAEFGTLAITARTCDTRPPEEFPETTAFLEILTTETDISSETDPLTVEDDLSGEGASEELVEASATMSEVPAPEVMPVSFDEETETDDPESDQLPEGTLFSGWMFASSPALNALQHPVYDVWVIDCKMVDPSI